MRNRRVVLSVVLGFCAFIVATVSDEMLGAVFLNQGVPGLLAGCLGPVVGAIAAGAMPARASRA